MAQDSGIAKSVWPFFALAYAFSWLFWVPLALATNGLPVPAGVARFLTSPLNPAAFGPLVAALLLTLLREGGQGVLRLLKRGIDWRFKKVRLLPILLLPLFIFTGATLLSVLAGAISLDSSAISNPAMALVALLIILLTAGPLQEEFGWRGYALPRLQQRFNALSSSIVLGIAWTLWHLPLLFTKVWYIHADLLLFGLWVVQVVLTSILFTWIYNNTEGSILATLLFHTFVNWSIWLLLPTMQVNAVLVSLTILLLLVTVAIVLFVYGGKHLVRNTD